MQADSLLAELSGKPIDIILLLSYHVQILPLVTVMGIFFPNPARFYYISLFSLFLSETVAQAVFGFRTVMILKDKVWLFGRKLPVWVCLFPQDWVQVMHNQRRHLWQPHVCGVHPAGGPRSPYSTPGVSAGGPNQGGVARCLHFPAGCVISRPSGAS